MNLVETPTNQVINQPIIPFSHKPFPPLFVLCEIILNNACIAGKEEEALEEETKDKQNQDNRHCELM